MRRVRGRPFLAAHSRSSLCTGELGAPMALTEPPQTILDLEKEACPLPPGAPAGRVASRRPHRPATSSWQSARALPHGDSAQRKVTENKKYLRWSEQTLCLVSFELGKTQNPVTRGSSSWRYLFSKHEQSPQCYSV